MEAECSRFSGVCMSPALALSGKFQLGNLKKMKQATSLATCSLPSPTAGWGLLCGQAGSNHKLRELSLSYLNLVSAQRLLHRFE